MTQLRAVLLAPPGTQPKLLRWHHVWLAFALTGLGFCVGVLTLMLAATAYLKLNSTDLFLSYFLVAVCGLPDPGSPVLRFPSAPRDRPGPPSLVLPVLLRRPAGGVLCGPLLRPEPV